MLKRRIKYMNLTSKKCIKIGSVSQLVECFLGSSVIDIFLENLMKKYTSYGDLFKII